MTALDISFSLDEDGDKPRGAYRTRVPGLVADIAGSGSYPVRDISASGVALADKPEAFRELEIGRRVVLDLTIKGRRYLAGLAAEVVRVSPEAGIVGLSFADLDRKQEEHLDKLVLEVQKRLIAMRRAVKNDDVRN